MEILQKFYVFNFKEQPFIKYFFILFESNYGKYENTAR